MITKTATKLTSEARKALPDSQFAIPELRKYPISDLAHARAALAMVSKHGTPDQKQRVHAAVSKRYPGMGKTAGWKTKALLGGALTAYVGKGLYDFAKAPPRDYGPVEPYIPTPEELAEEEYAKRTMYSLIGKNGFTEYTDSTMSQVVPKGMEDFYSKQDLRIGNERRQKMIDDLKKGTYAGY